MRLMASGSFPTYMFQNLVYPSVGQHRRSATGPFTMSIDGVRVSAA